MTLTQEEFEIIYWIEYMGYNYPKKLSEIIGISEEDAKKTLIKLENDGLITIEMRDNAIYGSKLTDKGKEFFNDEQYKEWKEELDY
jgi:DNA-binding MarR family transcriptional regulator